MRARSVIAVLAGVVLLSPSDISSAEQKLPFPVVTPEQVKWTDRPGFEGVQFANISGDPSKPGIYVIRVKFSPGHMTRPHFHPEDRHVIVISGTWWMGEGDTFDPTKTVPLKAGSYAMHPAKAHHYDGAKDEQVILQIVGYGPSGTTEVHPEQGHTGPSLPK
ncbi:MAG TPA: cupin domain-containing protein [Myxococcaceae bacterium]|nr:cupin domain-containing protein [Myxococcaceae bacterium]